MGISDISEDLCAQEEGAVLGAVGHSRVLSTEDAVTS